MSSPDPLPHDDTDRRARWELSRLRERLDAPLVTAERLTRRTLAAFPVRVWRHFLRHNGFLLAASISYQSLFAILATLYTAFAVVGLWLGGSSTAIDGMISIVNAYIPGIISEQGLVHPDAVAEIATSSSGTLAITGAVAFTVALWTAIGFVTFARRAVRDILGLPYDARNFVLLKARDLLAALAFGVALIVGALLGWIAGGTLTAVLDLLRWEPPSEWILAGGRILSLIVAFVVNAAALAALFRFLTGTDLSWRRILPGALLGGGAMAVLQLGAGFLLSYTPTNPLLATFSIIVGFLLWFRLAGVVMLVAASWVALSARDAHVPLVAVSADEAARRERARREQDARDELRTARAALARATWWQWGARRDLKAAERSLTAVVLENLDRDERESDVAGPR